MAAISALPVGCLLMAAGNASRFGENKLAACFDGQSLFSLALAAIPAEMFARVTVVSQYPALLEEASLADYETMGSIKATPFGKTLEEAQALIEQIGREKGADAIVFEGVVSETSAPTYTTTEKIEKNDDGSKTRTATTSQSVFTTNRLLATFIKYKTQTN